MSIPDNRWSAEPDGGRPLKKRTHQEHLASAGPRRIISATVKRNATTDTGDPHDLVAAARIERAKASAVIRAIFRTNAKSRSAMVLLGLLFGPPVLAALIAAR
jgi:hypothetical protein